MACQPLYGGKPEKLVNPTRKKAPKEEPVAEVQIKEIEDCTADFQTDAKLALAKITATTNSQSIALTSDGDTAVASSDKTADPEAQARLLKEGIEKYRNALIKDPYNAEATLHLALAYDRVYRKGCAIAMLKRLAKLALNPKYARTANPAIDSISDNGQWFKRYRKDANAAVGR